MNREINFRSWNPKLQRMSYGKDIDIAGFQFSERLNGFPVLNSVKGEDVDEVLMQFTGVKDDSGIEIYEGDLIGTLKGTFAVEWNDDTCGFQFSNGQPFNDGDNYGICKHVIGNVFQNPDLLK